MRIEADSVLPFSRERVFRAYRDELPDFTAYLPNVRAIEVKSRKDEGAIATLHNVWHGGGDIPAPIVKVIGGESLSWDDFAKWDQGAWTCEWNIRTSVFTEAVSCSGKNTFIELGGDRTRLEIAGDISIDVKKVKGIPSFLAGSIGKTVENFLVKQITANLTSVSDALTKYLQSKG
ncbi:hypothetical protein [Sandaracinus amylolyticus]|uniref:hypothetical protein n=1 Tax=Sandaracinus amylolyticus TaxID=927083 RepID=UPI001F3CE65F|nr:hypothetical protein [Sandaracinus amylolyticus]UJR85012.1 Hypothetical protein I5071_70910 [Sandaracinus amylolyticus]